MSKKTTHGEARGRDIHDGKERRLAKSQRPRSFPSFKPFFREDDKYSNTIEFYDAIPKYFTNKRQMTEMREGPEGREIYLPTLEREFKYQDILYTLKINPARVRGQRRNLNRILSERTRGNRRRSPEKDRLRPFKRRISRSKRRRPVHHVRIKGGAAQKRSCHGAYELQRSLPICRSAGLLIEKKGRRERSYSEIRASFPW